MENTQGTIRRQTRSTLDTMEDIINKQKVSLDSQLKTISEIIEMIKKTKSKSIPEIPQLSKKAEEIQQDNMLARELLKALEEATKYLKVSIETLIEKVNVLEKRGYCFEKGNDNKKRKRVATPECS